ncbi:NADH dehydrogenase [ubiquinone] 1 alpha subcomplex subunit 8-like [Tubulanus polymorphus]|uniref:NADH dehydrogenase [ubiquinone] 1 alpha subcomplex subunit 8-like n=1 Tax=Tubulanus polymorphus TaxID=672921 RepID=UPI003DA5FFD2
MPIQKETWLPTYEELEFPEINVSTPGLRAASYHFGKYCDGQSKEFMLCVSEENDPRKCIKEGKEVTRCGIEFFHKLRNNCMEEFTSYMTCLDVKSKDLHPKYCRKSQSLYDKCVLDKLGLEKPPAGYFAKIRVHETKRAKPSLPPLDLPVPTPGPPSRESLSEQPTPKSLAHGTRHVL